MNATLKIISLLLSYPTGELRDALADRVVVIVANPGLKQIAQNI